MNQKATCSQFAVCFSKGSFDKLVIATSTVIHACNSGSEELNQEDSGFEGSQGYNSWFQASLAIYSKAMSKNLSKTEDSSRNSCLNLVGFYKHSFTWQHGQWSQVIPFPHICSLVLKVWSEFMIYGKQNAIKLLWKYRMANTEFSQLTSDINLLR